jgi:hypothetical protein
MNTMMMRNILFSLLSLALVSGMALAQKGKSPPEAGTVFHVSNTSPSWATCDIEFRDPTDVRWPTFFYGKPAGTGTFTYHPKQPRAELAMRCDQRVQKNGDQSRRVLGELLQDSKAPVVTLTIKKMGEQTSQGSEGKKSSSYAPTDAELDIDGKKVAVKAKATFRWGYRKGSDTPESVYIDLQFSLNAADLGLKNAGMTINGRAGITAYAKKH